MTNLGFVLIDINGRTIEVGDTVLVHTRYIYSGNGTYLAVMTEVNKGMSRVTSYPDPVLRRKRKVENYNIRRWEPEDRI
jgi:hypothetical protein